MYFLQENLVPHRNQNITESVACYLMSLCVCNKFHLNRIYFYVTEKKDIYFLYLKKLQQFRYDKLNQRCTSICI